MDFSENMSNFKPCFFNCGRKNKKGDAKMKGKKLLALLMAATIGTTLFTGCGSKQTAVKDEDLNSVPADPYEIKWYINGTAQNDVETVEKAVNEYLKDKLNVTIDFTIMESDQYRQKMTTMINAGEYFDLCFVSASMLSYYEFAKQGAFYSLDDFLDTALKDIVEQMNPTVIEAARVNGHVYALPVYKEASTACGWIYRKDIAEKYNIDMSKYKSFKDIMPVIEMIKKNEPDMPYPIDWNSSCTPVAETAPNRLDFAGFSLFGDGSAEDITLLPEAPEYQEACRTAREFYEKGLVRKDVLTATDMIPRAKNGNTFCFWYNLKPGKAQEMFATSEYEWDQVEVTPNKMDKMPGRGAMQAISATSKNPVRVARFLNLLNTDPYLKNLILFGVEGKHYNKIDDKTVEPIPNSGYDLHSSTWAIGNVFIDYLTPKDDPQKLEKLREFADNAEPNKNSLFQFDSAGFEGTISALTAVETEYLKQLSMGAMDPEQLFKPFADKLRAAGADEFRKEIVKQYDEYLKTIEK